MKISFLVERCRIAERLDLCYNHFLFYFAGDFSKTAKGISTKLSTQTADGLE